MKAQALGDELREVSPGSSGTWWHLVHGVLCLGEPGVGAVLSLALPSPEARGHWTGGNPGSFRAGAEEPLEQPEKRRDFSSRWEGTQWGLKVSGGTPGATTAASPAGERHRQGAAWVKQWLREPKCWGGRQRSRCHCSQEQSQEAQSGAWGAREGGGHQIPSQTCQPRQATQDWRGKEQRGKTCRGSGQARRWEEGQEKEEGSWQDSPGQQSRQKPPKTIQGFGKPRSAVASEATGQLLGQPALAGPQGPRRARPEMRKHSYPEGAEFSHADFASWEQLTILKGQVVEVELTDSAGDFPADLWAGFLVTKVELGLEGDMILHVKSLGCDDVEATKWLSTNFNRRPGCLHLCHSYPCEVDGDLTLHVTRLRVFSMEGFARDYITAGMKKQMKKWSDLMEDELGAPSHGLDITVPGREDSGWEEVEPMRASAKAQPPHPRDLDEERISAQKRQELRKRLDDAKAKMSQGPGAGAGTDAVPPQGPSKEPASPLYSPSPLEEEEALVDRRKGALRDAPRRSAHEGLTEEELMTGGEKEKGKKEKKRKRSRDRGKAGVLAIKDISTGSLQAQLLSQAAKAAQEKAGRIQGEKEKAKKKDPGALLVRLLQQATGGDKKKKKKKKKRKRAHSSGLPQGSRDSQKRRRQRDGSGDPGSSPSSSSGSGQTSGSELNSEDALGESSSSSEDLRMEPPLRKRAREKPGSVLQLLVEHARAQLDQSAKVTVGREEDKNYMTGVKLSSYFSIIIRPRSGRSTHRWGKCICSVLAWMPWERGRWTMWEIS